MFATSCSQKHLFRSSADLARVAKVDPDRLLTGLVFAGVRASSSCAARR